jgi:tetratricopeptide (TPR) repeat protein
MAGRDGGGALRGRNGSHRPRFEGIPQWAIGTIALLSLLVILLAGIAWTKLDEARMSEESARRAERTASAAERSLAIADGRVQAALQTFDEIRAVVENEIPSDGQEESARRVHLEPQLVYLFNYRIAASEHLESRSEAIRQLAAVNLLLTRELVTLGKAELAKEPANEAIDRLKLLSISDPNSESIGIELIHALTEAGRLEQRLGQLEPATEKFEQAVREGERLVSNRPRSVLRQSELARAYMSLGHVLRESRKDQEAADHFKRALELVKELLDANPKLHAVRTLGLEAVSALESAGEPSSELDSSGNL